MTHYRQILRQALLNLIETPKTNLRIIRDYYRHPRFLLPWCWLKINYLLDNPFAVSRRFHKKIAANDPYTYGETPLHSMAIIAQHARLSSDDVVYELGAGAGFTALWLATVIGCHVVAIEQIPTFAWRLQRVAKRFGLNNLTVQCSNFLDVPIKGTCVYLCGSNFEDTLITSIEKHLRQLSKGAKIITVSAPLTRMIKRQHVILKQPLTATFPWGECDVFLHVKQ